MRRTIILSGAAAFGMGLLGTVLGGTWVLPAVVAAQSTFLQAERVTVLDDEGEERIRLQTGPGINASVQVLDARGQLRAIIGTGGPQGTQPEVGGLRVFDSAGTQRVAISPGGPLGTQPEVGGVIVFGRNGLPVGYLGAGRGSQGDLSLSNILVLYDPEGSARVVLQVADDGTPSFRMLDADGNVTWSAE
jgi:hypothetical protein